MSVRTFRKLVLPFIKTNLKPYPPLFFSTVSLTKRLEKQIFANKTSSATSFLKEFGFSNTLLAKIEKTRPKHLSSKFEQTIKTKLNIFKKLGFSKTQIADMVSADPRVLYRVSEKNIERSVSSLKKVLGDKLYDLRIFKNFGSELNYDFDKTLVPNVEYLRSCGVEQSRIMKLFYNYPKFLLHKPEGLKEFVKRVAEIGVERESKLFVYAVRTIGSMSLESWEQKLDVFRGLGYTEVDIISTFRKYPNVFALSERKIKETAEFLLSSGKYDTSFFLRHPFVFIYSLERRLKPRLRVLEILDREKILKFKPSATVFSISDTDFFAKFVRPHLDDITELSFVVNKART